MRYRVIALLSVAFLCSAPGSARPARRRDQERRQGPVPADRLSGRHGAARHHLDDQSAAAELRPAARAVRARRYPGAPQGWTATLLGGGQPVAAAMVATNDSISLQLRLDVPKNAPMGTTNLTVTAKGADHRADAADRGHARQGPAGQAHAQAAAAVAARHLEVDLRVPDRRQERQRPQARRRPWPPGAAELRDELHRAIRQPGAERAPARCRPVQERQAQGPAAEHGRRRPLPGLGEGHRRGRHRPTASSASRSPASRSSTSPAATAC